MSPYMDQEHQPTPNDSGNPNNGDWIAAHQARTLIAAIGPRLYSYLEELSQQRREESGNAQNR